LYQRHEHGLAGGGPGIGGFGVLTLETTMPPLFAPKGRAARLRAACDDLDLVVDLGVRIGTLEWWRGLGTLGLLCGTAYALSPAALTLPGAAPRPMSESHWQEARAQSFAPLAYGADTGRRMSATDAVRPLADTPERPSIDLSMTLGQGDGFERVMKRAGVSDEEAGDVASLVSDAVALTDIAPGTRMEVTLGRRPSKGAARPLDYLMFRARFDLKLAVERVDGYLRLRRIPIAVDATPLRIQGRVGTSLYRSARASGAPAKSIEAYLKAIAARMSVSNDIHADDRFDMIVAHRRAETGEVEIGDLLYAGLDQGRKRTRLMRWASGGRSQWFEAAGVGETRGTMRAPVMGRLTSGFGMRRHPLLGYSRMHQGMDFGAPYGAPIVAATDGVIVFAGRHGGHGNYVRVQHGGAMQTGYAHMSRIVAQVGQRVAAGQLIGYVGSTGLSTGPHLHYEMYRNGVAINPSSVKFTTTSLLAGADLARFRTTLARLMTVRVGGSAAVTAAAVTKGAAPKS
jgi:murein DD-endopeptidase MepM/ murein hydrolase activator NlpD